MPEVVAQIVWIRQINSKTQNTCDTVEMLLSDLGGTSKFMDEAIDFLEELKTSEKERVRFLSITPTYLK